MKLTQSFIFEAAHTLKWRGVNVYDQIKSNTIHGHTYHASISIEGEVVTEGHEEGMVNDFNAIGLMTHFIKSQLDHTFLDEVKDLGRPTLENICLYIAKKAKLRGLCEVTVERKATGDKCTYAIENKKTIPIKAAK